MKHLFNNLSQEEKQSILEMHKGTKMVFSEQTTPNTPQQKQTTAAPTQQQFKPIWINGIQIFDGKNWVETTEAGDIIGKMKNSLGYTDTNKLYNIIVAQSNQPEGSMNISGNKDEFVKGIISFQAPNTQNA